RYNPEEMLLAALASCHMLMYLHLCAKAGVVVEAYSDRAQGSMSEDGKGGGRFNQVLLRPRVHISDPAMENKAMALHKRANALCYLANSVNFEVLHEPQVRFGPGGSGRDTLED